MKKLFTLLAIVLVLSSCESRSAKELRRPVVSTQPAEKIVVTTVLPWDYGTYVNYKVKRIDKGVVTFVKINYNTVYSVGDTILWKF